MMHHAALLLVAIALVLAAKEEDTSLHWRKNAMPGPIKEPTLKDRRAGGTGMLSWYVRIRMFEFFLHIFKSSNLENYR